MTQRLIFSRPMFSWVRFPHAKLSPPSYKMAHRYQKKKLFRDHYMPNNGIFETPHTKKLDARVATCIEMLTFHDLLFFMVFKLHQCFLLNLNIDLRSKTQLKILSIVSTYKRDRAAVVFYCLSISNAAELCSNSILQLPLVTASEQCTDVLAASKFKYITPPLQLV